MTTAEPNPADAGAVTTHTARAKGPWETVLATTPIVLTVLATVFAGLSSSEMTQSMFFRSLAAQQQSKAGDQWAFFQAKRIRGTSLEMTIDLLESLARPGVFDPAQFDAVSRQLLLWLGKNAGAPDGALPTPGAAQAVVRVRTTREQMNKLLADNAARHSLLFLTGEGLPRTESLPLPREDVQEAIAAVITAIREHRPETEIAVLVRRIDPAAIAETTRIAERNADAFDRACDPVNDVIRRLRLLLGDLEAAVRTWRRHAGGAKDGSPPALQSLDELNASFKAAALAFDGRRYRQEAALNRTVAELYEVQVRRSSVQSDRHRDRSIKFFYSMLVAQAGVTVASLALARAQRRSLWIFAALAGLTALSFSAYVFLSL